MSVNSPLFLESYLDFKQHIEDVYKSLNTYEKGKKFSEFAKDILSTREAFWGLKAELNPKATHDGGWDIRWINSETDEAEIHCESKLNIDGQETLGSIIDKFSALESKRLSNQPNVIQMELDFGSLGIIGNTGNNQEKPEKKYCIVTLSSVKNIEKRYAISAKKSVEFYKHLKQSKRIEIIDGESLYQYFVDAYNQEFMIPRKIQFKNHVGFVYRECFKGS
jgi:hypothetical protein